jgi:hypothetical protein
VGDELVAGVALLAGVALAGEVEGVLDLGPIDRRDRDRGAPETVRQLLFGGRVELLDDCEQVGEQLLVLYGNVGLCRNDRASECSSL